MNKADITTSIYESFLGQGLHVPQRVVQVAVNAMLASIARALVGGESVRLEGIGNISVKQNDRTWNLVLPTVPDGTVVKGRPLLRIKTSQALRNNL